MKQTPPKDKKILSVKRVAIFVAVFAVSLALRVSGPRTIGPYDDAYHWKRIAYSAAHFPRVLDFDPDREAWCPWPPLYDLAMGGAVKGVEGVEGVKGVEGVEARTPRPPLLPRHPLLPQPLDPLIWIPPIVFSLIRDCFTLLCLHTRYCRSRFSLCRPACGSSGQTNPRNVGQTRYFMLR